MLPVFKFTPEVDSPATFKLTVEINPREHTKLPGIPADLQVERLPALFPDLQHCLGTGEDSHPGLTRSQ